MTGVAGSKTSRASGSTGEIITADIQPLSLNKSRKGGRAADRISDFIMQGMDSLAEQGDMDDVIADSQGKRDTDPNIIPDYKQWSKVICGFKSLANWHEDLWSWAWQIEKARPRVPFVAVAPRGGGKTTNAEQVAIMVGARRTREFVLYIRATQESANQSISNISDAITDGRISNYFPAMAQPMLSHTGQRKAWNRSLLRMKTGFSVMGFGLDGALRGIKIDDIRPDLIIIDDVDEKHDSPLTTKKKIEIITQSILPAGATHMTVLAVQNLIIKTGIFSQLAQDIPSFLLGRELSGPHPAIRDLVYEVRSGVPRIISGTPVWEGQNIEVCENQMRLWGPNSFMVEAQHDLDAVSDGKFSDVEFVRQGIDEIPDLSYKTCWIDPAVTSGRRAHCQAICIDGVERITPNQRWEDANAGRKKRTPKIYRLFAWEGVESPEKTIRKALLQCEALGVDTFGVETNQGGDLWKSTFYTVAGDLLDEGDISKVPEFRSARAGSDTGGKEERADRMKTDYRLGRIIHVDNPSTSVLEAALNRFPLVAPDDLTDASFYSWRDARLWARKNDASRHSKIPAGMFFGGSGMQRGGPSSGGRGGVLSRIAGGRTGSRRGRGGRLGLGGGGGGGRRF